MIHLFSAMFFFVEILNYASECDVPTDEAGIMWDGITFAFLLIQRRIFNSYYFFHIRAETEVQAQLASRGAELIEELMSKQIKQQEKEEKEVLEKIKMKMDRIKAVHEKGRTKGAQSHYDGNIILFVVNVALNIHCMGHFH